MPIITSCGILTALIFPLMSLIGIYFESFIFFLGSLILFDSLVFFFVTSGISAGSPFKSAIKSASVLESECPFTDFHIEKAESPSKPSDPGRPMTPWMP